MQLNPLRWSFSAQCLLGVAACAGLLAYAIYVQFVEQLMPCPFCILQRIAFAILGLVLLLAAIVRPRKPGMRKAWGVLAALAALGGAGIAARHSWVQVFPPDIPSCGSSLSFMAEQRGWLGAINRVLTGSGDCSNIDWMFLGLTMPMWTLLWFVGLAVFSLYIGFKQRG